MKKILLASILLSFKILGLAQIGWSSGAKWSYETSSVIPAYTQMVVTGDDTLINGLVSSIIEITTYKERHLGPTTVSVDTTQFFEYLINYKDSILWYQKDLNQFVKLYDFTLKKEDTLVVKTSSPFSYVVLDITDTILSSESFKIQKIRHLSGEKSLGDYILFQLGSTHDFFGYRDVLLANYHRLICFEDESISYQNNNYKDCKIILKNNQKIANFTFWNTIDKIYVQYPNGFYIEKYDLSGRLLSTQFARNNYHYQKDQDNSVKLFLIRSLNGEILKKIKL